MKKLLNSLYVTTEDCYLTLEGENVVILRESEKLGRFPLHGLDSILCFSYKGASPALMGKCADMNIGLSFFKPSGSFLARSCGQSYGNVLLRKEQYRRSDSQAQSLEIARLFIQGKVYNARWVLERTTRDNALRVDVDAIKKVTLHLAQSLPEISAAATLDQLRGAEGELAASYFSVFNEMILQNKEEFAFTTRSRRPPRDSINGLLSFVYTILANQCASALEGVGLDSYVGFLHRDRAGRVSLALDLMEELRPIMADRFVITLINNRVIKPNHFDIREGSVYLSDDGRKILLTAWQERKRETITHPFLEEKIPWGLVPHAQALLLARYLRGDLDAYPPFLWK